MLVGRQWQGLQSRYFFPSSSRCLLPFPGLVYPLYIMAVSPNGVQLSIWMAVFTFITSVVIALRIWAIHLTRKSLQLHDYFVIVAHV